MSRRAVAVTVTRRVATSHFAYRLSGFTGPLRLLVEAVDGAWWFVPDAGGGTGVRWTYAFRPRPGRWPIVRAAVAPLWRAYARRVLARATAVAG